MFQTLARFALLAALLGAGVASAAGYTRLIPEQSRLGFSYRQMSVPMDGSFKRFKAQLAFDPAQPAQAQASFDVEVASIDVGSSEGNGEIGKKEWFDSATHPVARFVSSSVKALGNDRYEVTGKLTIKGRSREVKTPVKLSVVNGNAVFEGALPIRRTEFAIGEGMWADTSIVADEIQIRFRLVAARS